MTRRVKFGLLVGALAIVAAWAGTRLYARHVARVEAAVQAMANE